MALDLPYFQTPEFTWTSEFEEVVLSSFTFGFLATPVIGGYLAGKFGGKNVISLALTVGAVASIATPAAARVYPTAIIVLRVIAGVFMGAVDPAIQSLWAKWAPMCEKAQLTTCSYSGVSIAGTVTFLISGYLCTITYDNGWPFIFYVFGGFSLLCLIPWRVFVFDTPLSHPRISKTELKIITGENNNSQHVQNMPSPPWKKIFTSSAFWAILVAHVTYSWVTSWAMAYLPKYLKQIMKYDIKEDGIMSSLPYFGRFVTGIVCGYVSDWLSTQHLFATETVRKIFQVTGCLGCAACTIAIGFLDHHHRTLAVALLVVGLSFQNFTSVAFRINHLHIAPRFAGVLMGITVTCAMVASLSAPLITAGLIVKGTKEEWQTLFWIVAGLNVLGAVVFVMFAKGKELDWAKDQKHNTVIVIQPTDGAVCSMGEKSHNNEVSLERGAETADVTENCHMPNEHQQHNVDITELPLRKRDEGAIKKQELSDETGRQTRFQKLENSNLNLGYVSDDEIRNDKTPQ